MLKLKDKVIVITGGSGLLGKSICSHLKASGASVVNFDKVENDDATFNIVCDITDPHSLGEAFNRVIREFGTLSALINNAYPRTDDWGLKFEQIPIESWSKNVDWQLNSYFLASQKAAAIMTEYKAGSIINMASIYGVVGPTFPVYEGTSMTMPAAYAAIKGGLINFTRYLASYLGSSNVRVNAVSPGGIFDNQTASFVKLYSERVPLGRMGIPDDISPTVSFLISDDAKYITGQNIIIDGGWTCI